MDIVESNKSVFLPDVCNQHRHRRHGDGAESIETYVVWFCGIYMCIKVAVSFLINLVELYKPTAEFVFCLES